MLGLQQPWLGMDTAANFAYEVAYATLAVSLGCVFLIDRLGRRRFHPSPLDVPNSSGSSSGGSSGSSSGSSGSGDAPSQRSPLLRFLGYSCALLAVSAVATSVSAEAHSPTALKRTEFLFYGAASFAGITLLPQVRARRPRLLAEAQRRRCAPPRDHLLRAAAINRTD